MKFKKLLQFLKNEGYADDIVRVIENPDRFNELDNDIQFHADDDVRAEYRALQRQAKGEPELAILNLVENQMDVDAGTMIDAPASQKSLDFSQPEIGDLPGGDVELNPFEQLPPEAQQFLIDKGYGPADQNPKSPFTAEDYLDALKQEGFGTTEPVVREDTGPSFEEVRAYAQQNDTPFGRLSDKDARLLYDGGYGEGPDAPAMGEQQIAAMLAQVKGKGPKRTGGPARADSVGVGSKMDELDSVQKNEKKFVDSLREAMPTVGMSEVPDNFPEKPLREALSLQGDGGRAGPKEVDGIIANATAKSAAQQNSKMTAGDAQKFANNPDMKNPVTEAEGRNTGGAVPVAAPVDVAGATGGNQSSAGYKYYLDVITDAINQTEALENIKQNPVTKTLLDGDEPNANTPQSQQKNPYDSTAGKEPEPVGTPSAQQAAVEPPQPKTPYSGNVGEGSTKPAAFGTSLMPGRFNNTPYPVTQMAQTSIEGLLGVSPGVARAIRSPLMPITNTADLLMRNPGRTAMAGIIGYGAKMGGDQISEEQAMDGSVPGVAMRMDEDGNVIPVETPIAVPATEEMQTDLQSQADQALQNFGDFVTGQSQFKKLEANQQQLRQEDNIRKLREGI